MRSGEVSPGAVGGVFVNSYAAPFCRMSDEVDPS